MNRNIPLSIAFLTAISSIIVLYLLFSIKHSVNWWEQEQYLFYFIPIWSLAFGICAYSFSKDFLHKKRTHFPVEKPENYNGDEAVKQWQWEKKNMLHKACVIGRNIFGVSVPLFVLIYIDKSYHLKGNWLIITFFVISTIICFVTERKLKKELYN